ncbi:MAG: outer membrane beta-barrel protein [Akkermansia sp.]
MMKSAIIALATLAVAPLSSQAYDSQKYDSTFGMEIDGAYGWAAKTEAPDLAGGLFSLYNYVDTGSVYHQFSFTTGGLTGSSHFTADDERLKSHLTTVPLLLGYTLNAPISESAVIYLGGKAGISFTNWKVTGDTESLKESGCKFAWAINAGLKFAVSDKTDFKIGYEYLRLETKKSLPFHVIQAGFAFNF